MAASLISSFDICSVLADTPVQYAGHTETVEGFPSYGLSYAGIDWASEPSVTTIGLIQFSPEQIEVEDEFTKRYDDAMKQLIGR